MNTYDLHLLKPPSMLWVEPGFGGPESVCSLCPPQPSVYPNDTLLECCTSILDQGTVPETRWCGTPAPPSSMDTPVSGVPVQHSCPGVCAGLHGSSTVPALSRPQESRLAKKGVCGPWLWWPLCWGPSSSVLALAAVYWLQFTGCSLLSGWLWLSTPSVCAAMWSSVRVTAAFRFPDGSGPVALNCSSATSAIICASPSDGPVYTALALTPHLSRSWCHRWATAASSSSLALPLEPAATEA